MEQPPRWLGPLFRQFAQPSGWLGRLAGRLMAKGDADDRWIVDLLDIQPGDRVLEVGFGPGVAIQLAAERATEGLVAGVDPSEVMVREAIRRNQTVAATLESAGFHDVTIQTRELGRETVAAIIARR